MQEKSVSENGLSHQQDQFCKFYVIDFNATKAAVSAKYSKKTAAAQGSRLLKNVKIQERIEFYKKQALLDANITIEQVVNELKILGFSDITDLFKKSHNFVSLQDIDKLPGYVKRAIKSLEFDGPKLKVKFHSKEKALELLGKYLSMFNEDINLKAKLEQDNELVIKVIQVNGGPPNRN